MSRSTVLNCYKERKRLNFHHSQIQLLKKNLMANIGSRLWNLFAIAKSERSMSLEEVIPRCKNESPDYAPHPCPENILRSEPLKIATGMVLRDSEDETTVETSEKKMIQVCLHPKIKHGLSKLNNLHCMHFNFVKNETSVLWFLGSHCETTGGTNQWVQPQGRNV